MVRSGMTPRGSRVPRGTRLASVISFPLTAKPTPKYLLGGSTPDIGCNGALQAVVDGCRSSSATSSRDTFGESAKNSDSTAVRPTVGAPGEWYVLNVLLLQDTKVGTVVIHLALKHGGRAVRSSADGVWRCDAHVQSSDCVTQCLGEDIGGAEIRTWD